MYQPSEDVKMIAINSEDTMTPDKLETRVNALNDKMQIYIF